MANFDWFRGMRGYSVVFLILGFSCAKQDPAPQPVGVISFNTNLSSSEPFANYMVEYQAVFNAGARGAQTAAPWKSLNPTGSTFDLAAIANPYFGLSTLKNIGFESIFLNIPIIAISERSMPDDIAALEFDDPQVKARFRALIDAIKDHLNERVKYVAFGNEVDTYFATHPTEWAAYINLVEDARNYLRSVKPDIQVAVTTTFEGASLKAASQVTSLNANMDVVALTYYPIDNGFIPRDPATVEEDVSKMLALAKGKPLVMQEWGYPSSTVLGSSNRKQAVFFTNSFTQLRAHGPEHFPFISFFKYRDWDAVHVQVITGQVPGQQFYEFMSSLGAKRNDGTVKEAYLIIEDELKK